MGKSDLEYRQAILTFIDILGFKELVEKRSPSVVCEILEAFHEQAGEHILFEGMGYGTYNTDQKENYEPEIIFFSDCIIRIVFPENYPSTQTVKNKSDNSGVESTVQLIFDDGLPFRDEIVNLSFAQERLLGKGILTRGAMVYGDIIYDKEKNILFGPALQKAYQIESKMALNPRIIVDSTVIDKAIGSYPVKPLIVLEEDGLNYIDCVGGTARWHWNTTTHRLYIASLKSHRPLPNEVIDIFQEYLSFELLKMRAKKARIEEGLSTYFSENLSVFIKYAWLAEKYNESVVEIFSMYADYLTEEQLNEALQLWYLIDFPDITEKLNELREMASSFPKRIDFAIELSKAIVNFAAIQKLEDTLSFKDELQKLTELFPKSIELAVQLGMYYFNLSLKQPLSEMEQAEKLLRTLLHYFPNEVRLARTLGTIIVNHSANRDFQSKENAVFELRALTDTFPHDTEIASLLIICIYNKINKNQSFMDVAQDMAEIRNIEKKFSVTTQHPRIPLYRTYDKRITNLVSRLIPVSCKKIDTTDNEG